MNYDDGVFVSSQPHVSGGLSWSGIAWAFTNGPFGEWYPLSMLSHMLDCDLYGLNPTGHHLTNVLLHAASAVTLFLALWRMTGALWPSALVAALFALHPLRVESVAWVAERRDVLSGLFFMLTLGAYGEYVRQPQSLGRYLAVVVFFALGLMAKPMLVTLPPLLLLLDYWPLGRFGRIFPDTAAESERQKNAAPDKRQKTAAVRGRQTNAAPNARPKDFAQLARPVPFPRRVVVDKLPILALAIAAAGVTMLTHSAAFRSLDIARAIVWRGRFLHRLSGAILRSSGSLDFLCASRAGPAGLAGCVRGRGLVGNHGRRGVWSPVVSLLLRRLVLVRRNAGAGARADLCRFLCPRRPLHLPSPDRARYCAGLGGDAAGRSVAGSALGVWRRFGDRVGSA